MFIIWYIPPGGKRFFRATLSFDLHDAERFCAAQEAKYPGSYYMIQVG